MPRQLGAYLLCGQPAPIKPPTSAATVSVSPPSCTALTNPLRRDVVRVAHHSTAATVLYGSRLTPLAGCSHVSADTWVSISASRASAPISWAASRASSAAASSSMAGLAPSSAHDAHAAITHAATSGGGGMGGPGHRDRHLPASFGLIMGEYPADRQ